MNSHFKEMIRLADSIADNAHLGQVDKNGWPYISHPRRVAFKVREIAPEELRAEAQIVALLHDTVEDTEATLPYLAWYFSARIVDAVDAVDAVGIVDEVAVKDGAAPGEDGAR